MLIKVKLLTLILVLGLIGLFNSANATTEDSDNDGYSNLCEKLHKTDPNDAESKPSSNITINVPSDVKTIQEAINAAIDGDTIVVSQGKYRGNINFKGKSITLTSTAPLDSDVVSKTIIEGTEKGSVVTIDSNSILKGFTITSKDLDCRGIYVQNASPTIENCTIIDNQTTSYGGGVYISAISSRPKITNCIITRNKDKSDTGKSAQISGGTPQISQSWINGQGLVNTTETTNTESTTKPSVPNNETILSTEPTSPPTEPQSPTTASDTVVIEPLTTDTELTSTEPPTITQQPEGSSDTIIENNENLIEDSPVMPLSGTTIWYVDNDAPDTGTGKSWNDAFKYLEDALNDTQIQSGDEIRVAQGTYKPDEGDTPLDRTATFQLINGVSVMGGYAGIDQTLLTTAITVTTL
jgi:ribosomal protein L24